MSSSIFTKWFQGRVKKQHKADKNAQTFILEPIYTPSGLVDGGDDSDSIDIPAIDDLENLSKTTEDTGSIDNTEAENIEVEDSEVEDTREIDDTSDDLSDDASDSVEATHDASDLSDEDIGEEISFIDDLSDEDTSDDISATEEIPEVIEDETPEEPTTATTTPEDDTVDDTVEAAEDDTSEETVAEDDTTEESIAEADDTSNDDSLGETASEETVAETDEELSDDETSEETVAESEDLDEADEALLDEPPKFELPAFDSGVFTVGESGEVGIDFLYDGGKYQGELGIFSLSGLDALEFEAVEDFIAEAAQRVASNSELGYIIISDPSEGAKFNGSLEGGKDWNSGDYRGVKTFTMKAGDKFAVMLVPNARVSEVVNNPAVGGAKQPLFSLSTANPEDEFHIGQIADVTGDGNTFVMEDMRADDKSDRDYNDLIFQVRGAAGSAPTMDGLIDEGSDWRETDLGEALLAYVDPYFTPAEDLDIFDEDLSEDSYEVTIELEEPVLEELEEDFEPQEDNTEGEAIAESDSDSEPQEDNGENETVAEDDSDSEADTDAIAEAEIEALIEEFEAELLSEIEDLESEPDAWGDEIAAAEEEFEAALNQLENDPDVTSTVYEDAETELDEQLQTLETEIQDIANQQQAENDLTDAERAELYETLMVEASSELDLPAANQPSIGVLDTGFNLDEAEVTSNPVVLGTDLVAGDDNPLLAEGEGDNHGTEVLQTIAANNETAPLWLGRTVGSGKWAESLVEFVDAAKESGQPNALVNLSFDLTETQPDGQVVVRDRLTPEEWQALEYARDNNVLVVAAAGNDGGQISALGQASRHFDNVLTVGAAEDWARADYSSYGEGLDLLAPGSDGENAGTSLATAQVTGVASRVWAANPDLSYRQVIELLKRTATDLDAPNWDAETGAGLLNATAAVSLASLISLPDVPVTPPDPQGLTENATSINERPVFLRRTFKGISNFSNRVRRKVSRGFGSAKRSLSRYSSKVQRTFRQNISRTRQRVQTNLNRARQSATKRLRKWVGQTVNRVRKSVRQHVTRYPSQVRSWVKNSFNRVRNSFTNNVKRIRNNFISNVVSRARRGLNNTISNIRNRVTNGVKRVWNPIGNRINNIRSNISKSVSSWLNRFRIGRKSRAPHLFRDAYNRIKGSSKGITPVGDAYRWGNGWTQKFRDKNGSEMLLMLENGASQAFWVWHGNLAEYKNVGGATGHLGYPRSDEIPFSHKGKYAVYQRFAAEDGKSRIHYSAATGSVATWGQIGRRYTDIGGASHWLGMPKRREYNYGNDTIFSDFEGGKIAYQRSTGRVEVLRPGQNPSWVVKEILKRFPGLKFSTVVSAATGKALDAGGDNHAVYPHSSPNPANNYHQWGFYKVGSYYMLINKATGKALDAGGNNGKLPYGHPNPNSKNSYHLWKIQKDGNGYSIVSKATGRALDSGGANGNHIYMYPNPISGNSFHQWKLNLPDNGSSSTRIGYVNSGIGLNFRRDPSTNQAKISTLPNGTKLTILEKVTGQPYYPGNRTDWYKVKVGSKVGYVAAYYVKEGSNNIGGSGKYHPKLTSFSAEKWDLQSGDDNQFRSDSPFGGGDQRWKTDDAVRQVYTDLSKAIFGDRVHMNTGYAYDQGYRNYYGKWHAGIDMGSPAGTAIKAVVGGTVRWVNSNFMGIDSDDGNHWVYGHLGAKYVYQGKRIEAGTTLARLDSANHLHLEVQHGHGYKRTNGAHPDRNFVRNVTMSPLQAYWQLRNR
ncbi:MAG: DUF4114 domain-containing protein [Cyanobacteria bacterium SBC]|nr:DUF4114 domain-containing protein [Cyanobacteria bacterium SBC]